MLPVQLSTSLVTQTPSLIHRGLSYIYSNPLLGRISANWKTLLMDSSTATTIGCFVLSFLGGNTILLATFGFLAVASGVGSFYMRRFAVLSDLETTAHGLKQAKEHFEGIAKNFEKENVRLSEANKDLQRNNDQFRTSNATLIQTNTSLALQVTQLRNSAEQICSEVERFKAENSTFNVNISALEDQLRNSRALCEQIEAHLASQQLGLGDQLKILETYLSELRQSGAVHSRIQELATLQQQAKTATGELHQIQLQYASERSKLESVRESLEKLGHQFDEAVQAAAQDMRINNAEFRQNISALAAERDRLYGILNPRGSFNPSPIHVV